MNRLGLLGIFFLFFLVPNVLAVCQVEMVCDDSGRICESQSVCDAGATTRNYPVGDNVTRTYGSEDVAVMVSDYFGIIVPITIAAMVIGVIVRMYTHFRRF